MESIFLNLRDYSDEYLCGCVKYLSLGLCFLEYAIDYHGRIKQPHNVKTVSTA